MSSASHSFLACCCIATRPKKGRGWRKGRCSASSVTVCEGIEENVGVSIIDVCQHNLRNGDTLNRRHLDSSRFSPCALFLDVLWPKPHEGLYPDRQKPKSLLFFLSVCLLVVPGSASLLLLPSSTPRVQLRRGCAPAPSGYPAGFFLQEQKSEKTSV